MTDEAKFAKFRQELTEGVRVQMLINRGPKVDDEPKKRWLNWLVSTNSDEYWDNFERLSKQMDFIANPGIRHYACLNARNLPKAVNYFQHRQLNLFSSPEIAAFYSKINKHFCSALMQPDNKLTKYFLLDIDTHDNSEIECWFELTQIEIKLKYPTPNGWHYITNGFNPEFLEGIKCDLKRDALILLRS